MKDSPLSDLSFFRFPDLTSETVGRIVLLLLLLGVLVLGAITLQRLVFRWIAGRERRRGLAARSEVGRLSPPLRETLEKLTRFSTQTTPENLLHDPASYETAVAAMVEQATPEEIANLGKLRRTFHLNVMNPELRLISTRQLLADLPVRVLTGGERTSLDLYCALFDLDEEYLFFDTSTQEEVTRLLQQYPSALLNYWREESGETLFRLRLEPVEAPSGVSMFRARHAFWAYDIANRAEFRLSVELPVRYNYLERDAVRRIRTQEEGRPPPEGGEGVLRDLSYTGGAFVAETALSPGGYAQLQFEAGGNTLRIMLEPISNTPLPEGGVLVRGRTRGMAHETKTMLYNFLTREQVRRMREQEALISRAGPAVPGGKS